jgi:hypothetical protein
MGDHDGLESVITIGWNAQVKGVEDLNICIIGAQGIVGVGATIRIFTALSPAAA